MNVAVASGDMYSADNPALAGQENVKSMSIPAPRPQLSVPLHVRRSRSAPDGNGSKVEVHAFDTFGRRLTDHVFFGAQETFEERLQALLDRATKATGSTRI